MKELAINELVNLSLVSIDKNLEAFVYNIVKPIIDQYKEIGINDQIEDELNHAKTIKLFTNKDEMIKYLKEKEYQTDIEDIDNAYNNITLYEVKDDTDEFLSFIYILSDDGYPSSGEIVVLIKNEPVERNV